MCGSNEVSNKSFALNRLKHLNGRLAIRSMHIISTLVAFPTISKDESNSPMNLIYIYLTAVKTSIYIDFRM